MISVSAIQQEWHTRSRVQRIAIVLLIAAALFEITAFITQEFNGYDSPYHNFWIREWHNLGSAGILYPRWLPDSFHGFGEPSFYFYAPLTFVITNVVYTIFASATPQTIAKITVLFTLAASGYTMWLYLRSKNSNVVSSLLGALLYCVAPYRFFDYSVRSALSEHVAFIFVPLVFWGMDMMINNNSRKINGYFLLAFSFALILITNLPMAVVAAFGLGIYALSMRPILRNLLMLAGASISSVILAAFYLLPAYALSGDVQLHHLWTAPSIAISSPILSIFIGQNVAMSLYNWLGFIAAWVIVVALWRNKDSKSSAIRWVLLFFIVLVLPYISRELFNFVPPFTIMQRPERMTVLLLVIAALLWNSELAKSEVIGVQSSNAASNIVILWSVGVIILIAAQLAGLHAHIREYQPIDDAPEYAPRWLQLSNDWGAKLNTSFASDSQTVVWQKVAPQAVSIIHTARGPYCDTAEYQSQSPGVAIFRRSFWPEWRATIDGKNTEIRPDSLGRLTIDAPEGHHIITLRLETSSKAKTGLWISGIGLLAMISLYFGFQPKRVTVSQ